MVYHYPVYSLKNYVRKSYFRGFSQGIFRSVHPDKSPKLSLLKIVIFPLLAARNFIKNENMFCSKIIYQKYFERISLNVCLINVGYAALYWGEADYQIKKQERY